MKLDFKGLVAVVTGASRGLGKATALALAERGCDVVVNYEKSEGAAQEVVKLIEKLGRSAVAVKADVSKKEEVEALYEKSMELSGHVDILVNNAGIHQHLKIWELPVPDWERVLAVNLTGAFLCTKAFVDQMKERRSGKIVNISSVIGYMGTDHEVHYAASKSGLVGLTKSLALELAPFNINVNAVAPGYIRTDMTVFESPEQEEEVAARIPLGELGEPEDIANTVAFLCSKEASYITGEVVHVNGGLYRY
ncbi:MAG: 3-oxoacyl-ACP reductase FabG [Thermoplasmata archaeon]|nr:MAG: 3-oxoacyl-ACP reductase FabG [Thermoplasmata archaeon]